MEPYVLYPPSLLLPLLGDSFSLTLLPQLTERRALHTLGLVLLSSVSIPLDCRLVIFKHFLFNYYFLVFWDRVSLGSLGCHGTSSVDQPDLEPRDLPASVFWVQRGVPSSPSYTFAPAPLPSAGIAGVYRHSRFMWCFGRNEGFFIRARQALCQLSSILSIYSCKR